MSNKFYKEYRYIKFCKICKVQFRPQLYDKYRIYLGLCYECKRKYHKKRYREYYIPYFNALPPEKQKGIRKARYEAWRRWVIKNIGRRRMQALKSYHARKHAHSPQTSIRAYAKEGG